MIRSRWRERKDENVYLCSVILTRREKIRLFGGFLGAAVVNPILALFAKTSFSFLHIYCRVA
jgi:hypothetical protein